MIIEKLIENLKEAGILATSELTSVDHMGRVHLEGSPAFDEPNNRRIYVITATKHFGLASLEVSTKLAEIVLDKANYSVTDLVYSNLMTEFKKVEDAIAVNMAARRC